MKHSAAAARALIQSPALLHHGMPSCTLNARGLEALARAFGSAAGLAERAQEAALAFIAWPNPAESVTFSAPRRTGVLELRPEHVDFTTTGSTHHA